MTRYVFLIIIVLSMTNLVAWAEPDSDYIRIARISYMEGDVSFQNTADVDWTAASINLPLQPGDRIYTGPQGRAEIEFDEGSVLRLAERTDIQFLSLNEDVIQIRILTGLTSLTVLSEDDFEMDTPAAALIVLRKGVYRFETQENGDTDAIVRKGELEAVSHRFVRRIGSGEHMFVTADENSSYRVSQYDRRDGWDEWTDRRNADVIARASRKYLPDNVYVGVSDLDRHGRWVTVESYGDAWIPYSIGVSWSPYSVGRWCYRPVWGWTWVSYESWGWLPYHYGRWHHSTRYGWCWLPGPSFSFNFWSPGLVTFYNGPSWVSWCALGPGDYYSINNYYYNRRLYNHQVVNLRKLHHRDPGDSYNRHVRGAYQTVEVAQFRDGGSRAIATKNGYRNIDQPWNRGSLVRERLPVQPTSRSFSADPDRRAVRSSVEKPKPALVHAKPTVLSSKRDGYVRVINADVTSRTDRKAKSADASGSGDNRGIANSNRDRILQSARSSGNSSAQRRSDAGIVSGNEEEGRTTASSGRNDSVGTARNNSDSIKSSQDRNTVQSSPRSTSRQGNDRSGTVRSEAPRNDTEADTGRSSSQQRITGSSSRPITSSRSSSKPQNTGSSARERARTNRSSDQSSVSPSTSSSSRIRSAPPNPGSSARENSRTNRDSGRSSVPRSSGSSSQSAPSSSSQSDSSSSSVSSRSSSSKSSTSSEKSSSSNKSSSNDRKATRRTK